MKLLLLSILLFIASCAPICYRPASSYYEVKMKLYDKNGNYEGYSIIDPNHIRYYDKYDRWIGILIRKE